MTQAIDREIEVQPSNPLGLDGIEFIEYVTSRPQALGKVLEMMDNVFGDLTNNGAFRDQFLGARRSLEEQGVRATVDALLADSWG